jgi:hypothetical protein
MRPEVWKSCRCEGNRTTRPERVCTAGARGAATDGAGARGSGIGVMSDGARAGSDGAAGARTGTVPVSAAGAWYSGASAAAAGTSIMGVFCHSITTNSGAGVGGFGERVKAGLRRSMLHGFGRPLYSMMNVFSPRSRTGYGPVYGGVKDGRSASVRTNT